jgi:hypothetical protein
MFEFLIPKFLNSKAKEQPMTALIESKHRKQAAEAAAGERVDLADQAKRAANGELIRAEAALVQADQEYRMRPGPQLADAVRAAKLRVGQAKEALDSAVEEERLARKDRDDLPRGFGVTSLDCLGDEVAHLTLLADAVGKLEKVLAENRESLAQTKTDIDRLRGEMAVAAADALLAGQDLNAGAESKALSAKEAKLAAQEAIINELGRRHEKAKDDLARTHQDVAELVREASFAEAAALQAEMLGKLKEVVTAYMPRILGLTEVLRAAGSGHGTLGGELALQQGRGQDRVFLFRPGDLKATAENADLIALMRDPHALLGQAAKRGAVADDQAGLFITEDAAA